ncbi:thiamine phosphate synthase [Rapidithrix thailandica]|uniref:Thiamine phosphate synthase n=1 Tax=Rapidithrix thailandica TaxID=413964 RepID=A0AAW9SIC7_9BACT
MKLRVITDPEAVDREIEIMHELFALGLECLHLRKPGYEVEELEALISAIKPEFRNRLVLHNHFELVKKYQLGGLHLPERIRETLEAKNALETYITGYKNEGYNVGTSVHQKEILLQISNSFDHVMVSPVFTSISKQHHIPAFSWDIAEWKGQLKPKVVGLGGISEHTLEQAWNYGFEEVAVLGSVWLKPARAMTNYLRLLNKANSLAVNS